MLRGWNSRRHGSSFRYREFGLARNNPCLTKSSTAARRSATFLGSQMSRFQIWLASGPVAK